MWNGKKKAITFSYDDGVEQDVRLIELFDRYGMKCTFNLNSGKLGQPGSIMENDVTVPHCKVQPGDVASIYRNHEVAVHTVNHPFLSRLSDDEIVRETEGDRLRLSELVGYEVVGMAYPCGDYDDRVVRLLHERTGVKYARTTVSTHGFAAQTELLAFHPTVHQHREFDAMWEIADRFLALEDPAEPQLFYIWGHAYELDYRNDWARMEEFLAHIAGRDDVFYGTNTEVLLG